MLYGDISRVDFFPVVQWLSFWFCSESLAVAQWIVHMPPKRGIQVRSLSAGPSSIRF